MGEQRTLIGPKTANQVWSVEFLFDRTAEERILNALTIVDEATHVTAAIEVEPPISDHSAARGLNGLALTDRSLPEVNQADNGKRFCDKRLVA
ncbi:hypothetical protein ACODUM_03355 [Stenotrophomonas maltophilia]